MGKPAASRAERTTSFELSDFPLPTGREEEWRFAPRAKFAPLFEPAHDGDAVVMDVSLAPEVRAEVVKSNDPRLGQVGKPADRAAAAAWQAARQAVIVTIPAGVEPSEVTRLTLIGQGKPVVEPQASVVVPPTRSGAAPVETTGHTSGAAPVETTVAVGINQVTPPGPAAVQLLLVAEPASKGVVVVEHIGSALVNETVEIRVGEHAELTVVSLQYWAPGSVHASAHRAEVGRDAVLRHVVATFGGDAVRVTPDASFTAPGGRVELLGLYFADSGQYQEHRMFVDHGQPNCTSRVTYKGALQGRGARAAWVGDVLIQAEATGTDTYELNRNLLLTEGARADSVPNLEIETGEIVGAGHASATGRFDDAQLFYLMSRGIPSAEARRLVVHGFFAELISEIGVPEVEAQLLATLEGELARADAAIVLESETARSKGSASSAELPGSNPHAISTEPNEQYGESCQP